MTNKELAEVIIEKVGGLSNIKDAANCMTRLRMHLYDTDKLNQEELKEITEVLGVVLSDDYLQVVLGPGKVKKVADELYAITGLGNSEDKPEEKEIGDWQENKAKTKAVQKKSKFKDS